MAQIKPLFHWGGAGHRVKKTPEPNQCLVVGINGPATTHTAPQIIFADIFASLDGNLLKSMQLKNILAMKVCFGNQWSKIFGGGGKLG